MSSGSVRLRVVPLHQHSDITDGVVTPPATGVESAGGADTAVGFGRLWRENGVLMFQGPGGTAHPARLVWARPLSCRGGAVSILMAGKKKELAYLPRLEALDPASRAEAEKALADSMIVPRILRVCSVVLRFGNYYFDVETDRGRRCFLLVAPENNTIRPGHDSLVIRDVSGNSYEIPSISALDTASRQELDKAF